MGAINQFDIGSIVGQYRLKIAIETGTFKGEGASHLADFVARVYTVELIEKCYNELPPLKSNISTYLGKSVDVLPPILKAEFDTPCLFWLDAHLPSHHHNEVRTEDVEFPLESEMRAIRLHKDTTNDVFIIDDLRIYEDGPFEGGNWPDRKKYGNTDGIKFIYDLFDSSHYIQRLYNSAGYIILTPRPL